ncbi:MAG: hypothetical protein R3D68_10755 [Hyphomicrobiaceae bacterium]
MQRLLTGLVALMLLLATAHTRAFAGKDTLDYEPAALEAAIAKGGAVLLHYKTTW